MKTQRTILLVLVVLLISALPALAQEKSQVYNLHTVDVTTNSVTIAWNCNFETVDYFEVWYWTAESKAVVQVYAYDVEIGKLLANTTYNITVVAVLKGGDTVSSNAIQVTTAAPTIKRATRR
jgi:hypothetical protein